MMVRQTVAFAISAVVALFAVFPLTDTDIWWHLACAREWVTTWTPVREPVVNVHEYFQQTVAFVYNLGGARLLVAFKAILWGCVFALFIWPSVRNPQRTMPQKMLCTCHPENASERLTPDLQDNVMANPVEVKQSILFLAIFATILFIFRYQFEIRPVLFSLLFLGVYWNILPRLIIGNVSRHSSFWVLLVFVLQWLWCKCQGLYILGPIFACIVFVSGHKLWNFRAWKKLEPSKCMLPFILVMMLLTMPFAHREGLNLFLYPFGLLDRLLGLSPSAAVFASEIAENRSPITLLMAGENVLQSSLMIVLCVVGIVAAVFRLRQSGSVENTSLTNSTERVEFHFDSAGFCALWLFVTAFLALVAERNFMLFLPVLFAVAFKCMDSLPRSAWPRMTANSQLLTVYFLLPTLLIAFLLGLWLRSVSNYDSMVAYQRVPVAAAEWMKSHPHSGRLFNDDRAGGYLAFVNPSDSTYIDGRFILKTAEFFENYLRYAEAPQVFLHDADAQNMDRVVLPLRYYARWDKLLAALDSAENWHVAYRDSLFVVMDRTER